MTVQGSVNSCLITRNVSRLILDVTQAGVAKQHDYPPFPSLPLATIRAPDWKIAHDEPSKRVTQDTQRIPAHQPLYHPHKYRPAIVLHARSILYEKTTKTNKNKPKIPDEALQQEWRQSHLNTDRWPSPLLRTPSSAAAWCHDPDKNTTEKQEQNNCQPAPATVHQAIL